MKNSILDESIKNGLAMLAGVFLTLACAPFSLFPLGILSATLLLALWLDVSPKVARRRGFFYGLGLFGSGIYWVYISMHTFGDLPPWAAAGFTLLFIALLSLFPAFQGYFLNRFFPRSNQSKILCAFPAFWVLIEWIRSWIGTGFPWLFMGYSQTNTYLSGYAPLLSVYGVTLATAFCGALLLNAWRFYKAKQNKKALYNIAGFAFTWALGAALFFIPWTHADEQAVKVSLIQANIAQELKWRPEQLEPTLLRYKVLTEEHWDSDFIIWPEGAIPAPLSMVKGYVDELAESAKEHHSVVITGIPIRQQETEKYYNGVIALGDGRQDFYLKRRLVPFGEFIPFERWLGRLFVFMDIPMSQLTSGPMKQAPLHLPHHINLLTLICYEIAFPEQVVRATENFGLILTLSNDAWFGHSIAQAQHLQMGQMRALENGRPVLFVTNNGITALISAKGRLLSVLKPFESAVLTATIQAYHGFTPWAQFPMDPILLICILMIFTAFKYRRP